MAHWCTVAILQPRAVAKIIVMIIIGLCSGNQSLLKMNRYWIMREEKSPVTLV